MLSLASFLASGTIMVAADLHKLEIPNSKEQPRLIMLLSSNSVVAKLTINKTGTLSLEAENISTSKALKFGLVHRLEGKAKLEMLVDGKSELTLAAEGMSIQEKGYGTNFTK